MGLSCGGTAADAALPHKFLVGQDQASYLKLLKAAPKGRPCILGTNCVYPSLAWNIARISESF